MKQKSLLLVVLALLTNISTSAQHVTEEQALQKAQAFLSKKTTGSRYNAPGQVRRLSKATQNDAFYIFNAEKNGGFVIVSGDERTEEILGYSMEGNIVPDNMPENMKAWLKGYEEQIRAIPANIAPTKATTISETPIEPLIKSKWGQEYPYYLQTPEIDGQHCLTGCVATAMAQIMNYWQHPMTTVATIPTWKGLDEVQAGMAFDWNLMNPVYENYLIDNEYAYLDEGNPIFNITTNDQRIAVASLMKICGMAVHVNYGVDESDAPTWKAMRAFKDYFGYQNEMQNVHMDNYTYENWQKLIYYELAHLRPVFCDGYSDPNNFLIGGESHAFIIDGYSDSDFFHFNWGWDGETDGYFRLVTNDYNLSMGAIIGIQPEAGGSTADIETVGEHTTDISVFTLNGIVGGTLWEDYSPNNKIIASLTNSGYRDFKGFFLIVLNSVNGYSRYEEIGYAEIAANTTKDIEIPLGNSNWGWEHGTMIVTIRDIHNEDKVANGSGTIEIQRGRAPLLNFRLSNDEADEYGIIVKESSGNVNNQLIVHYELSPMWQGDPSLNARLILEASGGNWYFDTKQIELGSINYGSTLEGDVTIESYSIYDNHCGIHAKVEFYDPYREVNPYPKVFNTQDLGLTSYHVLNKKPIFSSEPVELNMENNRFPSEKMPEGIYCIEGNAFDNFNAVRWLSWGYSIDDEVYQEAEERAWNDYQEGIYIKPSINLADSRFPIPYIFDYPNTEPYSSLQINKTLNGQAVYFPLDDTSAKEAFDQGLYKIQFGRYFSGGFFSFNSGNIYDQVQFGNLRLYYYPLIGYANDDKIIEDLSELSNSKQYLIHTRDKIRGTLGVYNNHLASTNPTATGPYVCSPIVLDKNNPLITNASQLSSPYTEPTEGSLDAMIDGNTGTFWHSNWSEGGDDVEAGQHYFQVEMANSTDIDVAFQVTRRQTDNDHITEWGVYGTNNPNAAKEACALLAVIETPYTTWGETRVSDIFSTGGYKYLRFYINKTTRKNFGHLAEFQLYPATYDEVHGDASPFAIIQKNGGYYLYSVLDKAFITPMNNGNENVYPWDSKMNIYMRDGHFVFDFAETGYTINVNDEPGIAICDYGTLTDRFDDGNLLTIEEIGDFDPTEALAKFTTPKVAEYRYYNFVITGLQGEEASLQLSEFDLLDGALKEVGTLNAYAGSEGYNEGENWQNITDNDVNTKYCGSFNGNTYFLFDAMSEVCPNGYRIYTAGDSHLYPNRNPGSWKLYGSNTKLTSPNDPNWVLIDERHNDMTMKAVSNTPFDFYISVVPNLLTLNKQTIALLPCEETQLVVSDRHNNLQNLTLQWTSSNTAVATVNSQGLVTAKGVGTADIIVTAAEDNTLSATCTVTVVAELLKLRYYQLAIEAIGGGDIIQISEFDLLDRNDNEITPVTAYAYSRQGFDGETIDRLFDNDVNTKYCDYFYAGNILYIYIDAGKDVMLSGYRITTAGDTQDYPWRNPVSWSLYGSYTQSESSGDDVWMLLDHRKNDNTLGAVNCTPFDFFFDYSQEILIIDGVSSIKQKRQDTTGLYNLAGQHLNKVQKGINIVGGKKILIK